MKRLFVLTIIIGTAVIGLTRCGGGGGGSNNSATQPCPAGVTPLNGAYGASPYGYNNGYNNGVYNNGQAQQFLYNGQTITCVPTSSYYGAGTIPGLTAAAYGQQLQPLGVQGNCALYGAGWQVALVGTQAVCMSQNAYSGFGNPYMYQHPVYGQVIQTCSFGAPACACGGGFSAGINIGGIGAGLGFCTGPGYL